MHHESWEEKVRREELATGPKSKKLLDQIFMPRGQKAGKIGTWNCLPLCGHKQPPSSFLIAVQDLGSITL